MKKQLVFLLTLITATLFGVAALADEVPVFAVGTPTLEKSAILITPLMREKSVEAAHLPATLKMLSTLQSDFEIYAHLVFLSGAKQLESAVEFDPKMLTPTFEQWKLDKWDYVIQTLFEKGPKDHQLRFFVYDVKAAKPLATHTFLLPSSALTQEDKKLSHQISSQLFETILKFRPIFQTQIAFVSDRNSPMGQQVKELYVTDIYGENITQLTHHNGIVISPAFSRDNRYIVYSLIQGRVSRDRNINLYLLDLQAKTTRVISSKKGMNSGAFFHPNGKELLLTLTYQGQADLYSMDLKTEKLKRLTTHWSNEVDPAISPDGTKIVFLSDRPGNAAIYMMDAQSLEKSAERLSFVGKFHATPRISPNNQEILFSSWLENRFDLFKLRTGSKEIYRLTKDFGSNENPSFSPDGHFVVFSSQKVISRTKVDQNLFIMDTDGRILKQLTTNLGICTAPFWSN